MRKLSLLAALFLLSSSWMLAQNTSPSQDSTQADNVHAARVRGCLSGSADNYILTTEPGDTYRLEGDSSQLKKLVGSEIRVEGTQTTDQSSSSSSSGQKQITVKSVMKLSDTCNLPGTGK